jgi:hypothetical protein
MENDFSGLKKKENVLYAHGDCGDLCLLGFYLKDFITKNNITTIIHGTGKARTKIDFSLYPDLQKLGIDKVYELAAEAETMKIENINHFCKTEFDLIPDFYMGYPEQVNKFIDDYKFDYNIFVDRKINKIDKVGLFRYSAANKEWIQKNRPYEEWFEVEKWLKEKGYDCVIVGKDDPLPNECGFEDYRGKLSLRESLNLLCSCKKVICIQSWPSTVCQHYAPAYCIFDRDWLVLSRLWEFRYFGRASEQFFPLFHDDWVRSLKKIFEKPLDFSVKKVYNGVETETISIIKGSEKKSGNINNKLSLVCANQRYALRNALKMTRGFR